MRSAHKNFWLGLWAVALLAAQTPSDAEHARAAQEAQARGDFASAIREYEILARSLPGNAEIRTNLGIVYYLHHDPEKSLAALRAALALNPNLPPARLFAGLAHYRLGQPDAAVRELEKAVALRGTDPLARTWLGYTYTAQERFDLALAQFRAASELQPDNPDVWYALGKTCLELGKQETRQLLAVAPDGGRAWELAGEQWQLRGDKEKALQLYQGALERRPDLEEVRQSIRTLGGDARIAPKPAPATARQEDAHYQAARKYENLAHRAFERIASIAPDSARAHQVLAEALETEQRSEEAIAEYEKVLRLNPELPGIHRAIGISYLRRARVPEALREFEAEARLQPFSAEALLDQARALVAAGDEARAEKVLRKALTLDRPPAEIHKILGKLESRREDHRGAIRSLTAYLSQKPEDANAHYLLLRAYQAVGDAAGVRRQSALFKRFSSEAKQRSRAQRSFEYFGQQSAAPETAEDEPEARPQP